MAGELDPNGRLYLTSHRVLLYADEAGHNGRFEAAVQAAHVDGLELEAAALTSLVHRTLGLLTDQGLIASHKAMGGVYTRFSITGAGAVRAEEIRERQARASFRSRVLRTGVLRWLHDNDGVSSLKEVAITHRHVEGDPATDEELALVTSDLREHGFLGPDTGQGRLVLTDRGRHCADHHGGDVSSYEAAQASAGQTYNVHFNGTTQGVQVVQGNHNTVHQDNQSQVAGEVRGFLDSLTTARPALAELDADRGAELDTAIAELHQEVEAPAPAPSRMGALLRKIGEVLANTTTQVVTGSLTPLVLAGLNDLLAKFPELTS
ncbi:MULTISPECIES: hypothetical protein [unclassified Nocardiopsis]|uniref:hypothetical protein n=1 Tax=unclassified Nocardiopsis TaxID=2649073 RepID=UPI001300A208|nr:hypothetical protein [Nocardiopsis sp. TNDT3]